MRMTQSDIQEITGLTQHAAQVRWFKEHFGVIAPCDRAGPIMTKAAFEALVAKRYGLQTSEAAPEARPAVKMKDTA